MVFSDLKKVLLKGDACLSMKSYRMLHFCHYKAKTFIHHLVDIFMRCVHLTTAITKIVDEMYHLVSDSLLCPVLAGGSILQGLECKVVVYVPDIKYVLAGPGEGLKDSHPTADLPDWLQHLDTWNRRQLWFVASRTLSHLIVFVCACPRQ